MVKWIPRPGKKPGNSALVNVALEHLHREAYKELSDAPVMEFTEIECQTGKAIAANESDRDSFVIENNFRCKVVRFKANLEKIILNHLFSIHELVVWKTYNRLVSRRDYYGEWEMQVDRIAELVGLCTGQAASESLSIYVADELNIAEKGLYDSIYCPDCDKHYTAEEAPPKKWGSGGGPGGLCGGGGYQIDCPNGHELINQDTWIS